MGADKGYAQRVAVFAIVNIVVKIRLKVFFQ